MTSEHKGWSTIGVATREAHVEHHGKEAWQQQDGYWRCMQCAEVSEFTSPTQRGPNHVPEGWLFADTYADRDKAVIVRQALAIAALAPDLPLDDDERGVIVWAAEKYADTLDPKPVRHIPLRRRMGQS